MDVLPRRIAISLWMITDIQIENWERPKPSPLLHSPSPRRKWDLWLPAAYRGVQSGPYPESLTRIQAAERQEVWPGLDSSGGGYLWAQSRQGSVCSASCWLFCQMRAAQCVFMCQNEQFVLWGRHAAGQRNLLMCCEEMWVLQSHIACIKPSEARDCYGALVEDERGSKAAAADSTSVLVWYKPDVEFWPSSPSFLFFPLACQIRSHLLKCELCVIAVAQWSSTERMRERQKKKVWCPADF